MLNATTGRQTRPWRRFAIRAALVLLVAAAAGLAWDSSKLQAQARLATAYGARVACGCHYIGGRDLSDCRKDFEPGMRLVTLSADEPSQTVTARMLFFMRDSARYRTGQGCVPEAWAR